MTRRKPQRKPPGMRRVMVPEEVKLIARKRITDHRLLYQADQFSLLDLLAMAWLHGALDVLEKGTADA